MRLVNRRTDFVAIVEEYLHSAGLSPDLVRVELLAELLSFYPARLTPPELSLQLASSEFSAAEVAVAYHDLLNAAAIRFEGDFIRPGDDVLCFRASVSGQCA